MVKEPDGGQIYFFNHQKDKYTVLTLAEHKENTIFAR